MSKYSHLKKRIYEIIEKGKHGDLASTGFDAFIVLLIVLNVVAIILQSVSEINNLYGDYFRIFEIVSVIIFTIEYLLRVWTSRLKTGAKNNFIAVLKYITAPMAIIDLLAILPFYIPFLLPLDLRFLRILRLTRLLRLFKIQRYSDSMKIIGVVLKKKKEELFTTIFVTLLLIILASTIMFYIESDVQPDEFPDIITTFWWAVSTLTTIGYGDVYPVTAWGKVLSGIIALLGIGLVALPTGILSSGFVEELTKKKAGLKKLDCHYCPHCGNKLEHE